MMEDALRAEGLTLPQLRLLYAVAEQPEVSAATIARMCQITPQTLQNMLERAVREGWILRGTSERNHRIITASLTTKGKGLLTRGNVLASEIEAKLWRRTSVATVEQIDELLQHGIANLKAEL